MISWVESLQAKGINGFAKDQLQQHGTEWSDIAIKRMLNRLSVKGKIVSLYKGYYLIIPPQYARMGILPPSLFLDAFMLYLKRPYYVALLNAAAFHGAAHQQPQEYFVATGFPVLRPIHKKDLKINFVSIRRIPEALIEKRKTEAGYLNISNPVLTACDLVQYEKRVGGLFRVASVLLELTEVILPADFSIPLMEHVHVATLQRLGYLLQNVCHNLALADSLFEAMHRQKLTFFRVALKTGIPSAGFCTDNRWKVIVNTQIETDE